MLDVGLLHVLAQLCDLVLPLLVQLHLGVGGSASLVQPVSKVFDLPGKVRSLPLSLGTRLTFRLEFFLELLDTGLHLLHALLALADDVLLVLQLGGEGGDVAVLLDEDALSVLLLAVELGNLMRMLIMTVGIMIKVFSS